MRALFDCVSEERFAYGARAYKFQAVMPQAGTPDADDPEVNAFWNATPSGQITLSITNPAAQDQLAVGKRYYVDFTAVPAAETAEVG